MDNEATRHSLQKIGYEAVRQHQKEILENVLQGKDCLLVAPTGKYLYFFLLFFKHLHIYM